MKALLDQTFHSNFFVVFGPSKSGTTWLQKCIDSHPEVQCNFQIPVFPILKSKALYFPLSKERKSILYPSKGVFTAGRSPFSGVFENEGEEENYRTKLHLIEQLNNGIFSTHLSQSENANKFSNQLIVNLIRWNNEFFNKVHTSGDPPKIYGTKSYNNLEKFFQVYPSAKIVIIFRDGRDVAVSKRFHHKRQGAYYWGDEKQKWLYWLNSSRLGRRLSRRFLVKANLVSESSFEINESKRLFSNSALEKISGDWALVSAYLYEWQQYKPQQILPVFYHNMIERPEIELTRVFDFLEVETSMPTINDIVLKNSFSKLKKKKKGSFFRSGKTGDWKNYFTEKDKAIFKRLAGEMLIKLGFEENNDW